MIHLEPVRFESGIYMDNTHRTAITLQTVLGKVLFFYDKVRDERQRNADGY